jgi:hypothetical protein
MYSEINYDLFICEWEIIYRLLVDQQLIDLGMQPNGCFDQAPQAVYSIRKRP